MKLKILTIISFFYVGIYFVGAQDGKIIEKQRMILSDSTVAKIQKADSVLAVALKKIEFYRITYLSDSLKIKGFIAKPIGTQSFPCIISNRGGSGEFGKWNEIGVGFFLGKLASWGYVAIGSQYRGNDGSEGQDEIGGKDLNDVLSLVNSLNEISNADTSRIGIEGASRGGMMTYLALKESCKFKAAVVLAGAANAFTHLVNRPDFEENVYAKYIPDYHNNKEKELKARSAVFWADKMCKTTPLLIMHGSSDWRVTAAESLELVNELYKYKHPLRYILYEGADHRISEFRNDYFSQMKNFFQHYLKENNNLPNMELHGR
ncbi:prolyl oligopeptidase family serine peptidase [Aquimarina addita]|uniref:Prolyl oligopeptidase family serine peptidase n=1 Tax=Aquimarina addita TaxID=870485 RepID=A0ABP6ULN9_9FLAO